MNPTIYRIKELLGKEAGDVARECEEILNSNSAVLTSIEIPLKNARDIYYRRADLNRDSGGRIAGFEDLIPRLERQTIDSVGIHVIDVGGRRMTAFTNPDVTELIGVLCRKRADSQNA